MSNGEIYNDSVGRCNLYDNPYNLQMQSRPELVRQRQEIYAKTKDTLETQQIKLEKKLFQAFQKRNFQLLQGKFVVVGSIGKYIFLAIMLPAYIFAYRLPKWLMADAIPFLFKQAESLAHRAVKAVRTFTEKARLQVKGVLKSALDPVVHLLKKVERFYQGIKQGILKQMHALLWNPLNRLNGNILQPLFSFMKQGGQRFSKISQSIRNGIEKVYDFKEKVREALISFPQKVFKMIVKFPERLKVRLEALQKTIHTFLNPAKSWVHNQLEPLRKRFEEEVSWLKTHCWISPKRYLRELFLEVKGRLNSALQPISDRAKDLVEKGKRALLKYKEKIKEKVRKGIERAWAKSVERFETASSSLAHAAINLRDHIQQMIPQPVIAFFTPFVKLVQTPFRLYRSRKELKEKLTVFGKKIHGVALNFCRKMVSSFKKGCGRFKQKIVASSKKLAGKIKKGALLILEMLRAAFYLLRLIVAWVRILIRYGMQLVRQKTLSLFP